MLQKLKRRVSGEVEDPNLIFLGNKEIMEDDGRERDVVEAEDDDDSIKKPKGIES